MVPCGLRSAGRLQSLPIDQAPTDPAAALSAMTPIIASAWNAMNVDAVELAMQGPLAGYFQGLSYDAADDTFSPTTDEQLAPMYEAIFQAAPTDPVAAASWLTQWKPNVDVVLSNLDRGQDLAVSYAYVFASMVRAYETVGYPLDIVATATALGVPSDMVVAGGSTLTGNGSPDIFYLFGGNQTVNRDEPVVNDFAYGAPMELSPCVSGSFPAGCRETSGKHPSLSALYRFRDSGNSPAVGHSDEPRASYPQPDRVPRHVSAPGTQRYIRFRLISHNWHQPRHSIFICISGCNRLASNAGK